MELILKWTLSMPTLHSCAGNSLPFLSCIYINRLLFGSSDHLHKLPGKKRKHKILHDEVPALFADYVLYSYSICGNTKSRKIKRSPSVQTRVRKTRLFIVTNVGSPLLSLLGFMTKHPHFVFVEF